MSGCLSRRRLLQFAYSVYIVRNVIAFFIEACSHDWSAFTGADEDRAAQIRSYT
jgi:hypothetical protein